MKQVKGFIAKSGICVCACHLHVYSGCADLLSTMLMKCNYSSAGKLDAQLQVFTFPKKQTLLCSQQGFQLSICPNAPHNSPLLITKAKQKIKIKRIDLEFSIEKAAPIASKNFYSAVVPCCAVITALRSKLCRGNVSWYACTYKHDLCNTLLNQNINVLCLVFTLLRKVMHMTCLINDGVIMLFLIVEFYREALL